jgi:signal transduction histidine kinase
MFDRARHRLTLLYIAIFAIVLGVFSAVFYFALATVLQPTLDIDPDVPNLAAAEIAYAATIQRIGTALIVADIAVVGLVGVVAWLLAARTLRPIQDAHRRQRRFVADASHEMRTPLAGIRAAAEGAMDSRGSTAEMRSSLNAIVDSTERLARLTDDLLLLARTDDRLLEPQLEPFDLSVAVAEVLDAARQASPANRVAQVRFASDLLVSGDSDEVRRAVANLIDNAYRYSGPDATVQVTTRASDSSAIVEVADNGPGITATDLPRIFDPFYRVRADAKGPAGSGLGLAIARSVVERSGGSLSVATRVGAGTTFVLSLPRFRVPAGAPPPTEGSRSRSR